MKKSLLKTASVIFLFLALFSSQVGFSQSLMTCNFEDQPGTLLTETGWMAYCQAGVNPVKVTSPGLTFPGYPLGNIGNAASLTGSGENIMHPFELPDLSASRNIYVSFMVSVKNPAGGNFLSISGSTLDHKRARVFVNEASPYNLGLSFGSSTPVFTTGVCEPGATYLVVLKYEVIEGACNDAVSMYLFSDGVPSEEPATATLGPLRDPSLADICPGSVTLHQNDDLQDIVVDGIRVSSSWTKCVTEDTFAPLFSDGYPAISDLKYNRLRLDVSLNEPGKAFYLVVPAGSAAPSAEEIIAGEAYGDVTPAAAGTIEVTGADAVYSALAEGLAPLTAYDIYVIASDNATVPNVQPVASLLTVTTLRTPDASLSDLRVDGTTVTGFDPALFNYVMVYEPGTTTIPEVTFTLSDMEATAKLTSATDLTGDDNARSTFIEVTAYDGETKQVYAVSFDPILTVENIAALRAIPASDYNRVYQVTGEVFITATSTSMVKFVFVQDDSEAALFINNGDGKISDSFVRGDGLKNLRGTLTDYSGLLGFELFDAPAAISSSGNVVVTQSITATEFINNFEKYESELIRIEGIAFSEADGSATFIAGADHNATAGDIAVTVRALIPASDIIGSVIPYMADVTGIATWYNTVAAISPREVADLDIWSSDAGLTKIVYNRSVVPDFDATQFTYEVVLPQYARITPIVQATLSDSRATITIEQAVSITGTEEERTATITVVSPDKGVTNIYKVIFSKEVVPEENLVVAELYPIPASTEITVKNTENVILMEVYNSSGLKLQTIKCGGETERLIYLGGYPTGFYFIKLTTPDGIEMLKFIIK